MIPSDRSIKRIYSYTNINQDYGKLENYEPEYNYDKILNFSENLIIKDNPKMENLLKGCLCSICLNVPFSPVECNKCSAVFCARCVENWKKTKNVCPVCKKINIIVKNAVHVTDLLEIFKIKCPNKGCTKLLNYSDFKNHLKNCDYKRYKCTNDNCHFVATLDKIRKHVSQCDYLKIKCKKCGKDIYKKDLEKHDDDIQCLKKQIQKLTEYVKKYSNRFLDYKEKYQNEQKKNDLLTGQIQELLKEREETFNDLNKISNKLSKKYPVPIIKEDTFKKINQNKYGYNSNNEDYIDYENRRFYNTESNFYKKSNQFI